MTKIDASGVYVCCFPVLLALLLLLSVIPFPASAQETSSDNNIAHYTLTGSFEGTFDLSSDKYQLFYLKDVAPGKKWTGRIHIENKAPEKMYVALLSIASDIQDTTLFNALDLDISHNGKTIYSGSYNAGLNPVTEEYEIKPNEALTFDVEVSLPYDFGNEMQRKEMDSTWTFEAKYTNSPQTGNNLISENTANLYFLWILFFSVMAAVIVTLRIRSVVKAQKEQSKEVNNK